MSPKNHSQAQGVNLALLISRTRYPQLFSCPTSTKNIARYECEAISGMFASCVCTSHFIICAFPTPLERSQIRGPRLSAVTPSPVHASEFWSALVSALSSLVDFHGLFCCWSWKYEPKISSFLYFGSHYSMGPSVRITWMIERKHKWTATCTNDKALWPAQYQQWLRHLEREYFAGVSSLFYRHTTIMLVSAVFKQDRLYEYL